MDSDVVPRQLPYSEEVAWEATYNPQAMGRLVDGRLLGALVRSDYVPQVLLAIGEDSAVLAGVLAERLADNRQQNRLVTLSAESYRREQIPPRISTVCGGKRVLLVTVGVVSLEAARELSSFAGTLGAAQVALATLASPPGLEAQECAFAHLFTATRVPRPAKVHT